MKKEMETVYKNKDNVVYTISNDLNSCYDIDVPDDVETVMLGIREDETIRTGALILACMAYLMDKIEKKREAEDEFSM